MPQALARRLRSLVAVSLSGILVALSPGLFAYEAAAASMSLGRASGPAPLTPVVSLRQLPLSPAANISLGAANLAGSLMPTLAPAINVSILPTAIATAKSALPQSVSAGNVAAYNAASIAAYSADIAPQLEALKKGAGSEQAASIGGGIENVLTGAFNISARSSLSGPAPGVPAPAEDDRAAYQNKRARLAAIAKTYGISASLPVAGPALTRAILDEASRKKVVFSDFDDTLGAFNSVLQPDVVEAIVALRKAGKHFVLVTDRGDVKRANSGSLTAFESLAVIPSEFRAGIYVAPNGGGKVYRYDEKGEPHKVWEFPAISQEMKSAVMAAAQATKGRLASVGATQYPGDPVTPPESANPYGYALMLAVGTAEATVKSVAKIFGQELASRGIEVEVLARLAKDSKNPPYVMFSVVNKSAAVGWISGQLGLAAKDAVAVGDSMYMPRIKEGPLAPEQQMAKEEAERLSGGPMPLTGNETDRNMEKGLPGMMALSVGGTADAAMADAWVLESKGPEMTKRLFYAMARPVRKKIKAEERVNEDLRAKLAALAGVESLSIGQGKYRHLTVVFRDRPSLDAAPSRLQGLDGQTYFIDRRLSPAAVVAENAAFEAGNAALLRQPGALSATYHHEGRWPWIDVVFASAEQMAAADKILVSKLDSPSGRAYEVLTRVSSEGRPVADSAIESAAASVAAGKGGVWSRTEYNMIYSLTLSGLRKQGATEEQLRRFRELADAAPVVGGGFNRWSGD